MLVTWRPQIRHPAGISTVDIHHTRALNGAAGFHSAGAPLPVRANGQSTLPGETMNKADLIDRIAASCHINKTQAASAIDTTVDSITAALRKGDRVALIGFGTFSVSQRKARNGRNPQTGATIKIAARRAAKFTPGAELKKSVNKKEAGPRST